MADYNQISKEEFDAVYEQYLPNQWIKFGFKYFSKETEMKDMYLKKNITYLLLSFFILGFIGTVFNLSKKIILISTILYSIIIFLFVGYMFSVVLLNNKRISKIANKLDITLEEYNLIVKKFYGI